MIKRAQALGFSLKEIATLLDLASLTRMQRALAELRHRYRVTGRSHPCPIIEALVEPAAVG